MSDWLHNLPLAWMALLVFVATYLVAGGIYGVVMALAGGERVRTFKAMSPGMLPPLGIIFGLFVALTRPGLGDKVYHANRAVSGSMVLNLQ